MLSQDEMAHKQAFSGMSGPLLSGPLNQFAKSKSSQGKTSFSGEQEMPGQSKMALNSMMKHNS